MRTIDADALKELFSEVIGHIAKKPEMNGNLEHMIRASAMVIQMIDDAPTVQPYTTTHDSIPAETGKNDGDRTSGDCISRTQAIDEIHEDADWLASQGSDWQVERMERDKSILMSLPSVQPEINRSEFPNNSDTISRQQAIEPESISEWKKDFREYVDSLDIARDDWKGIIEYIDDVPTVQPDDDRLERCRFEYINACKIVTYPTPDTTKKDIADAYAVVRALNPIFGEEGF